MDKFQASVEFVKNLAGDYYHGRFSLKAPSAIQFIAGQYVIFLIGPPKLRHTLSIASSPKERGSIDVLQSVAPMGGGSKWVMSLKDGDAVQFLGPLGRFTVQKAAPKKKVFVATGCGIAPFRAMIFDYLESGGGAPVILYWGLRFESDLFWQDELTGLASRYQNFQFFTTLSKAGDGWTGMRGRVTDHVIEKVPNLTDSEFYLCGRREMIVEVRKQLTDAGVSSDQIFTETFF